VAITKLREQVAITKLRERVARNTKLGIAIFRIIAAVDRFLGFLGKWKAVEENRKAVEEN
jgi:hypothetical protein